MRIRRLFVSRTKRMGLVAEVVGVKSCGKINSLGKLFSRLQKKRLKMARFSQETARPIRWQHPIRGSQLGRDGDWVGTRKAMGLAETLGRIPRKEIELPRWVLHSQCAHGHGKIRDVTRPVLG